MLASVGNAVESFQPEHLDSLIQVLSLIRKGGATTRPELGRVSQFGRTLLNQRLTLLEGFGLVEDGALRPSTGGRAAREIAFAADRASILVAVLGGTSIDVGLAKLDGTVVARSHESRRVDAGPIAVMNQVVRMFEELLASAEVRSEVWGLGIGVPTPVDRSTGHPGPTAIVQGWEGYPVREQLAQHFGVPVWVDNDVNLSALGELRAGAAVGIQDALYIKVGHGIGSGIITAGEVSRGAHGYAGNIPHIEVDHDSDIQCRCGHFGCLEAVAGGRALVQRADELSGLDWELSDLLTAAKAGDPTALELVTFSGRKVGTVLAALVNFHNPSKIILGGAIPRSSPAFLSTVRETVFGRADSLATQDLDIRLAEVKEYAGLKGAAYLVADSLFDAEYLRKWLPFGSPIREMAPDAT